MHSTGKAGDAGLAGFSRFAGLLLAATLIHAAFYGYRLARSFINTTGILPSPHGPFGGDFVNLWTAARLVLSGAFETIYQPERFMAFQEGFTQAYIGHRVWVYPPHSLLFAWPFGTGGYFAMLAAWALLGLAVLALGARRFGFGRVETAILVLSPASMVNLAHGQSGSLVTGLLLLALAARPRSGAPSAVAAAILTVKPQIGLLLLPLWLVRRRWRLIAGAAALTLALVGLSALLFGGQSWRDYAGATLPELKALELEGGGAFMYLIPSLFMSLRLLGVDGQAALMVHAACAAAVWIAVVWRLVRLGDATRQAALVLCATCLVTPYLHVYDLGLLLAGALAALKGEGDAAGWRRSFVALALGVAWVLPKLVAPLGLAGFPVAPLLVGLVCAAAWVRPGREAPAPAAPAAAMLPTMLPTMLPSGGERF